VLRQAFPLRAERPTRTPADGEERCHKARLGVAVPGGLFAWERPKATLASRGRRRPAQGYRSRMIFASHLIDEAGEAKAKVLEFTHTRRPFSAGPSRRSGC